MSGCAQSGRASQTIPDRVAGSRNRSLLFVRRLHMYLGVALVPWFIMYGIGGFVFNHPKLVESWLGSDEPEWTVRLEREYRQPVPPGSNHREIAARILQDFGMEGRSYWAWPDNGGKRLTIIAFTFLSTTRLSYHIEPGRIVVEDRGFRLDRFFADMHERGGFLQRPWLTKVWGGLCDVMGLSLLIWTASGLYVWWKSHRRHTAGAIVLAAGVVCFTLLAMHL